MRKPAGREFHAPRHRLAVKPPGLDERFGIGGGWTPDGSHANMGGRNCQDAESFVRDLKLDAEPSKTADKPA